MKLFANATNQFLAKLVSIEFLSGLITAIFVAGVFWNSITGSIAEALEASEENKEALVILSEDVAEVKTDIEVMKQSQEDYQKYQKERQEVQSEELHDIKSMLMDMSKDRQND